MLQRGHDSGFSVEPCLHPRVSLWPQNLHGHTHAHPFALEDFSRFARADHVLQRDFLHRHVPLLAQGRALLHVRLLCKVMNAWMPLVKQPQQRRKGASPYPVAGMKSYSPTVGKEQSEC
eukprot:scaffold8065_cov267-Pinguiococcus_pyrenoidosus.AAC.4